MNYGNPLIYPVSVSDFPSPERGVLCISIGDLTPKSALLLFTLLSACKRYTEDSWLLYITHRVDDLLILIEL